MATPGRLLELIESEAVLLSETSTLLLDEADRLLSPAFAFELESVLKALPPPAARQTLLFSATFPYASRPKAARLLRDRDATVRLRLSSGDRDASDGDADAEGSEGGGSEGDGSEGGGAAEARGAMGQPRRTASAAERYAAAPPPETIRQRAILVDVRERTPLLRHLLEEEGWARCLVFVSSQKSAEHVADKLQRAGYAAEALHGGLSQQVRGRRLAALRAAELRVLVATNVAARGLDVASLEAVVNYELPRSTADYTHRVGRTGRAGEDGVAVSFVTSTGPGNAAHFDLIERRHGGMRVPREVVPGPAAIVTRGCNRMCAQAAATCTF